VMTWQVTIEQLDAQLWSVFGVDDIEGGDHMGSNVVGDEQAARDFAGELFGGDAQVTVNPLQS
jgi:hypothetical protein